MSRPVLATLTTTASRATARLRSPATQTDLLQVVKTVVAAVLAWVLAVDVFDLAQPFLAPWTALLTVHATVYRSLSRGAQSVAATFVGIAVSVLAVETLGVGVMTLSVALLVGLLVARTPFLRHEGVAVATTALFVLTTGFSQQEQVLAERFLDVLLGVGVGIAVNLVVIPPLDNRSARMQVDDLNRAIGGLMNRMAEEMRRPWGQEHSGEWIEATRGMDDRLDHAWRLVRHAQESGWWNPRRRRTAHEQDAGTYVEVLHRLGDGISHLRSMARTIDESTRSAQEWDPRFREAWVEILDDVGHRVADPEAEVAACRESLIDLTHDLSREELPGLLWPLYGSLIALLRNLIDVVDDVASSQPVRT